MRLFFSCLYLLSFFSLAAQEEIKTQKSPIIAVDSLYREDQFYFGFTYNTLQNKPDQLAQNKFSTGFSAGFLRDMPVNKARTVAIAPGLGITYNNYIQNLSIQENGSDIDYSIFTTTDYSKNRLSQLFIDIPIEFRWRTSTYTSYKFWRVHGGVKFSYLVYDRYIYKNGNEKTIITQNPDYNKLQYGVYLATGYNTFNLYAYYGLNSLFKSAQIEGNKIDMSTLNLGLIFYIL
ncbi:porin family protein [Flavobacterium sp. NG2]|uniref:porin family protein n=1 Tax=Flavobacterium sp. NG2 TaxID=3097547 RepID=UPI002A7FEBC5|nr:porin family protein [Flavobacterium sp. NG2]WPR72492.1 porin family protein [Flavobacterium sp. NG2]